MTASIGLRIYIGRCLSKTAVSVLKKKKKMMDARLNSSFHVLSTHQNITLNTISIVMIYQIERILIKESILK